MGSFLSCFEDGEDRCRHCHEKAQALINNECDSCMRRRIATQPRVSSTTSRNPSQPHRSAVRRPAVHRTYKTNNKPSAPQKIIKRRRLFGEYQCSCGRQWESRRSYRNKYLICMNCRKHVYARFQRELRPSDMSGDRDNAMQDHPKELCQMCMELGHYCGKMESG